MLVLLLVTLEGMASLTLFARAAGKTRPLAESQHTQYDAELGWVNVPGLQRKNFFKTGAHLTTNRRGFRGKHEVETAVPEGRRRVICAGDSFTFGYGVDDDETWCQLLWVLDSRVEPVNIGLGGYGFDQAYLAYRRDGTKLQHDVLVLAFITNDFRRMRFDRFRGYGKPWLQVDRGKLAVRNVPVPRGSFGIASWFTRNAELMQTLRAVQIAEGLASRLQGQAPVERGPREVMTIQEARDVLQVLLADLKRLNEARGSRLILVHLPTLPELRSERPEDWIAFLEEQSWALGIPYVNLFEPFGKFSDEQRTAMFFRPGQLGYPGAAGHLNAEGNRIVASLLQHTVAAALGADASAGERPRQR